MSDKTICVDIDGVIADLAPDGWPEDEWYGYASVEHGAYNALKKLKRDGWRIVLHTGRHINHAEVTLNWLRDNEIPYDLIQFGKPPARYYVDDRAIRFTNWDDVLERVGCV